MKKIRLLLAIFSFLTAVCVLNAQSKEAAELYNQSNQAIKEKDYVKAISLLNTLLLKHGDDIADKKGPIYYRLGKLNAHQKKYDEAIRCFRQSIENRFPKVALAYQNIAICYKKQGDNAAYEKTLLEGYEKHQAAKVHLGKMLSTYYLSKATKEFNVGTEAVAQISEKLQMNKFKLNSPQHKELEKTAQKHYLHSINLSQKSLSYNSNNLEAVNLKRKADAALKTEVKVSEEVTKK